MSALYFFALQLKGLFVLGEDYWFAPRCVGTGLFEFRIGENLNPMVQKPNIIYCIRIFFLYVLAKNFSFMVPCFYHQNVDIAVFEKWCKVVFIFDVARKHDCFVD